MNVLQELKAARALITHPDNWGKEVLCMSNNKGGFAFCALGALQQVGAINGVWRTGMPAVEALAAGLSEADKQEARAHAAERGMNADDAGGLTMVPHYNNSHTHEQVLGMFDRAIAALEGPKALPESLTKLLDVQEVEHV